MGKHLGLSDQTSFTRVLYHAQRELPVVNNHPAAEEAWQTRATLDLADVCDGSLNALAVMFGVNTRDDLPLLSDGGDTVSSSLVQHALLQMLSFLQTQNLNPVQDYELSKDSMQLWLRFMRLYCFCARAHPVFFSYLLDFSPQLVIKLRPG